MRTVKINGVEYTLRYTLRALFIYEEITGKSYSGDRMVNSYILLCAMLMANNKDFPLTFDDVIDACDLDPSIFETFLAVLEEENKRISMIVGKDDKKKRWERERRSKCDKVV